MKTGSPILSAAARCDSKLAINPIP